MNIDIPDKCPVCGEKLDICISDNGIKNLFCLNKSCPSKFNEILATFLDRLGVMGVSNETLSNWGLKTLSDVINFKPNPIRKNECKFSQELDKKLWRVNKVDIFVALSAFIPGVGRREMKKFWDNYAPTCLHGNISISDPSVKEQAILDNLDVVGEAFDSIVYNPKYKEPVEVESPKTESSKGSICFTGKLETMTRSVAQEKARKLGYEIAESVAKGLGTLVVADAGLKGAPSSKLKKAMKLGIRIMGESEFNAL